MAFEFPLFCPMHILYLYYRGVLLKGVVTRLEVCGPTGIRHVHVTARTCERLVSRAGCAPLSCATRCLPFAIPTSLSILHVKVIMSQMTSRMTQQPVTSETSGHLLQQLDALKEWFNNEREPLAVKLSSKADRDSCMAVLKEFYEHVIQFFPSPQEYPWRVYHEQIKLMEASFDVFALVGVAFCYTEDFHTFSKLFFIRVLDICHVLDGWLDAPDVSVEPGVPTPKELYLKGEQACVGLLRAWLGSLQMGPCGFWGWQVAREILMEHIAFCQGTKGISDGLCSH